MATDLSMGQDAGGSTLGDKDTTGVELAKDHVLVEPLRIQPGMFSQALAEARGWLAKVVSLHMALVAPHGYRRAGEGEVGRLTDVYRW